MTTSSNGPLDVHVRRNYLRTNYAGWELNLSIELWVARDDLLGNFAKDFPMKAPTMHGNGRPFRKAFPLCGRPVAGEKNWVTECAPAQTDFLTCALTYNLEEARVSRAEAVGMCASKHGGILASVSTARVQRQLVQREPRRELSNVAL